MTFGEITDRIVDMKDKELQRMEIIRALMGVDPNQRDDVYRLEKALQRQEESYDAQDATNKKLVKLLKETLPYLDLLRTWHVGAHSMAVLSASMGLIDLICKLRVAVGLETAKASCDPGAKRGDCPYGNTESLYCETSGRQEKI